MRPEHGPEEPFLAATLPSSEDSQWPPHNTGSCSRPWGESESCNQLLAWDAVSGSLFITELAEALPRTAPAGAAIAEHSRQPRLEFQEWLVALGAQYPQLLLESLGAAGALHKASSPGAKAQLMGRVRVQQRAALHTLSLASSLNRACSFQPFPAYSHFCRSN